MTSIGVGKPHWRLTEERSMMRVVEKLEVLGRSTLKVVLYCRGQRETPGLSQAPADAPGASWGGTRDDTLHEDERQ